MKRRFLVLLLCLGLLGGLLPTVAMASDGTPVYVALGDSITTGYRLGAGEKNFSQQVSENKGYALTDLAADGETSTSLLNKLADGTIDVSAADLVTITIGGNDLMEALYQYLGEVSGLGAGVIQGMLTSGTVDLATLKGMVGYLNGFSTSSQATTALYTYTQNLSNIVAAIRQANPDVTLLVTTQYNPYSNLASKYGAMVAEAATISDVFQAGVGVLNTAIKAAAASGAFTVVDVYTAFETAVEAGGNPCNPAANIMTGTIDLDFHPNQVGHTLIAQAVLAELVTPVAETPTITTQPVAASYTVGDKNVVPLTVEASVSDGGTLTYQWYSTTGVTQMPAPIPGATEPSYTPDISAVGTVYYICIVTNTKEGVTATATTTPAAVVVTPHVHTLVHHDGAEPTCTTPGVAEYWYCEGCAKCFKDAAGSQEIDLADTVIPATGHGETQVKNAKDATCTQEGYIGDKVCSVCGAVVEQGKAIEKLTHSYKDGKCTLCGAKDPNYEKPVTSPDTGNPQTGDNSQMVVWTTLLVLTGAALTVTLIVGKKRRTGDHF